MKQHLWPRVEALFHQALPLSSNDRAGFLDQACHGDDSLYREVASLLVNHQPEDQVLEKMKLPHLVQTLDAGRPTFNEGTRVGPYAIIRLLGSGGMGEVYLARDERLGRKVALKILPRDLAGSPALEERLHREAQTASALNHPNILTIYDFGRQGDVHYMVSEAVEGTQLREQIGQLSLAEAINYAGQIGHALEAAHAVGIIHRDIKPENIMVRSDGYIKVLDFGLAKLIGLQNETGKSLFERLSGNGVNTAPGLLMGTVNYMSPEQIRGQSVDLRADIWSWGVVLYEMLSGKRPFESETPGDTLAAILNKVPAPSSSKKEINRLVEKALAKEPDERYHTMQQALLDLEQISAVNQLPDSRSKARLTALPRLPQRSHSIFQGAGSLFGQWSLWASLLVLLTMSAVEGYRWYLHIVNQPFQMEKLIRLTTSGNAVEAAISLDGNYVAYATAESGRQALWLRQISTGVDRQLVPPATGEYAGITFSKDGFIYYVFLNKEMGKLYRVPMLGGDPKLLVKDVDSPISFSPDGKRFAFIRLELKKSSLMIRSLSSDAEQPLATIGLHNRFWAAPLWSPDGLSVWCEVFRDTDGAINLMSIRLDDGRQQTMSLGPWYYMGKPAWLRKGRSIAVAAASNGLNRSKLVEISLPAGEISEIPRDLANYRDVDSTPDSQRIVAVQRERMSGLWSVPLFDQGSARPISQPTGRFSGVTWTKSGKLISQTENAGRPDLWSVDAATGELRAITEDDSIERYPVASPDGKYLIYTSNRDGTFHLWRSSQDGAGAVRLTSDTFMEAEQVAFTPDSQWVVYTSARGGFEALWKTPVEGGEPVQITHDPATRPAVSPDGTMIACAYSQDAAEGWTAAIIQAKTGKLVRMFPKLPTGDGPPILWSRDGRDLLYVVTQSGVSNLWAQPISGGGPRQITHFSEDEIFSFALSPDGGSIASVRGRTTSDVVLVEARK